MKGTIIQIRIKWDCDLDFDWWRECLPVYSFERFDLPSYRSSAVTGFNFR